MDSGIDYQEGLNVKERVNLIEDDNEFSPMFEDSSNHGTSIASLIVSNNGKVKGINKMLNYIQQGFWMKINRHQSAEL